MNSSNSIKRITSIVISIALRVIVYSFLIVAVLEGAKKAYQFGRGIFYVTAVDPAPGKDVSVVIRSGTDAGEAADQLADLGLINNKVSFIVQSRFFELEIKPGTYTLNTSMTSREMLEVLNEGPPEETDGPV